MYFFFQILFSFNDVYYLALCSWKQSSDTYFIYLHMRQRKRHIGMRICPSKCISYNGHCGGKSAKPYLSFGCSPLVCSLCYGQALWKEILLCITTLNSLSLSLSQYSTDFKMLLWNNWRVNFNSCFLNKGYMRLTEALQKKNISKNCALRLECYWLSNFSTGIISHE